MTESQNKIYELTPTQEAMLIYSLYAPRSKAYFEQVCYSYQGPLDTHAFSDAWQQIVNRHAILRTSFSWDDAEHLVQIVHSSLELPFEQHDWRGLSASQQQDRLEQFLKDDADRGFELANAPLIRVAVLQMHDEAFRIVVSNHHIILDGWSMSVVRKEVSHIYQHISQGKSPELPPARPFDEYLDWLDRQSSAKAETFWRRELQSFELPKDLPIDNAAGKVSNPNETFAEKQLTLSPSLTEAIQSCARSHHMTLSTFVQAAWAVLLGRYCSADDVAFGITVSGRPYDMPGVESMVGLLINTLPVRIELDPNKSCLSCLKDVQLRVAGLMEHEQTSLKQIQQWIGQPRNSPLFETLLVFENFAGSGSSFELDGPIDVVSAQLARTNYPMALIVDSGKELRLQLVFHRSRFEDDAVERMLGHLSTVLEAMSTDVTSAIGSLPLLTEREVQTLLHEWNPVNKENVDAQPVHRMFERQARLTPEAVAVSHEGRQVSYAELNARANQLAHYLTQLEVGPETIVGICLERSIEMVVAVLATLKARGAYVPLDPGYPKNRLAYMFADSGIQVLLTREQGEASSDYEGIVVHLDADGDQRAINTFSAENLNEEPEPSNLAYVIYTSGSTGNPKGVMIEHHSLTNFTVAAAVAYSISPGDRILQFASLNFDTSLEELFPALSRGATVVLRTEAMLNSADEFLRKCDEMGITILDLPTAYWHELAAELADHNLSLPESLRLVILGGEKALPERLRSWRKQAGQRVRLVNTYGPTETTIVATTFDLSAGQDDNESDELSDLPIGRPLTNLSAFVLDEMCRPVPIGIPGELYIGGAGVARGYLHRPDLTAEKFVVSPFDPDGATRLYKTGDLVCYRPDGNLAFLGRIDNQVKIRGFRVELEEIEQAIRNDEGVFDAVVVAQEDAEGDKRLVAYVVPGRNAQPTISELRSSLAQKLPAYMLPSAFLFIDSLPLMPNGKIDRKALPRCDHSRPELDENFEPPRSHLEESIAGVWCDLLKLDRVGVNDNFFELGGHSLLGARLISNLRRSLNVDLKLVDVFQAPTIARLAALIYQRQTEEEADDELASLLAEIENLSDEEAQLKFAEELAKGGSRAQALKLALISTGTAALEILSNTL